MIKNIKWELATTDANLELMSQVLGITKVTATVMANRGIRTKNTAKAFLQGKLMYQAAILDPKCGMKDAKQAFDRIAAGIRKRERIMIYGDYDADGVMSTSILYKSLKACGADVHFYIPHREEEGYGLNIKAVQMIKEEEYDLIIACDNGISALEEIAEATALGLDVIVIDHHEPGFVELAETDNPREDVIPVSVAVVDPKREDCLYPFKEMCAGGLAFRLMEAFYEYVGRDFTIIHDEMLALAAIATVCDIVELTSDNRAIVKGGLAVLNANKNVNAGLGQLIFARGYADKPIDAFTIGFVIGPCINATGRLESAESAVRLLISNDKEEQIYLSNTLSKLNDERKTLTRNCADRVIQKAKEEKDKVLVIVDEETHESLAGIVAGRIRDATNLPAIVLTSASDKGMLKGSGRSINGYNMFEELYANRDLLYRFGGHPLAAGLTLERDNVHELKNRLNDTCSLTEEDLCEVIEIDKELLVSEVTLELAKELVFLAPFGKGNAEPLFMTKGLPVSALRMIDDKNTIIFTFEGEKSKVKGIAFGKNEVLLQHLQEAYDEESYRRIVSGQVAGLAMDVVYTVETNIYNGRTSVQMRIRDLRVSVPPDL